MEKRTVKISRRGFLKTSAVGVAASSAAAFLSVEAHQGPGKEESRPMAIVLLGAPGAGKSEQAGRLAKQHAIPAISTGDLLRDEVKRRTDLGLQADTYMKAGQLVPDSLVNSILEARLSQPDCARGFILDGYPRTVTQAENLDTLLKNKGVRQHVILLDVPTETLLKRLAGRRVCPVCKRSYNIYYDPPKKEGLCDADGTPLVQRSDDKEEVVRPRLETYQKQTQAAIDYYQKQGRLIQINGDRKPEQVAAEIEAKLASE